MTLDDRQHADELDRFWDAVVLGEHPAADDSPEPDDVDLIAHLWNFAAPPAAGQARDRVRQRLLQSVPAEDLVVNGRFRAGNTGAAPRPVTSPNSRHAERLDPLPKSRGSRPGWLLVQLATAAVLILALAGGLFALGPLRPDRQAGQPAVLPAIVAPPIVAETMLDTTTDIPFAGRAFIGVEDWTLHPSPTALSMPPLGGPAVITVVSGTVLATVKGTEQQLARGEHVVVSGSERATFRAEGAQDAEAFTIYIVPAATSLRVERSLAPEDTVDSESWAYDPVTYTNGRTIWTTTDALASGPSRLVLERFTLPVGSALPPREASSLVWTEVTEGVLGLTLQGERLPFRWKADREQTFQYGRMLPPIAPGTTMVFRNAGDTPLVLYRLTITPLLAAEAAP